MAETPTDYRSATWSQSVVVQALWRARWVVVSAALIAGIYGYGVSSLQAKSYTATASLVLSTDQTFSPLGNSTFTDASRYVSNQVSIMTSSAVLDGAVATLKDGTTAGDLAGAATVAASDSDDVITVTTTATTPASAAARADAIAAAYEAYNAQQVKDAAAAAIASSPDTATTNTIKVQAAAYGDGVAVIEKALQPSAPSTPKPLRNALLLALATAVVAAAVALLRRGRGANDARLVDAAGRQLLGTVPVGPAPRGGRIEAPDPADHALALVALDYALDDCPSTVLVTGASRESGAASVVLGLATAAAASRRVVVVEADVEGGELLARCGAPLPARPLGALSASAAVAPAGPGTGASAVGARPAAGARPAPGQAPGRAGVRDVVSTAPTPAGVQRATFDVAVVAASASASADVDASALTALADAYDLVLVNAGPVATDPAAFALLRDVTGTIAVISTSEDPSLLAEVRSQVELSRRSLSGVVAAVRVRGARRRAWGRAVPAAAAPAAVPAVERTPART